MLRKIILFLALTMLPAAAGAWAQGEGLPDAIIMPGANPGHILVVDKAEQLLYLYSHDGLGSVNLEKIMSCSTGEHPGDKLVEGDRKTPVGFYIFNEKKLPREMAPAFGILAYPTDYPNFWDRHLGRGGYGIWLHGLDKPLKDFDSNGCVALENADLAALEDLVQLYDTPMIVYESVTMAPLSRLREEGNRVQAFLGAWGRAWAGKDYEAYRALYSADFANSDGQSFDEWMDHKRAVGRSVDKINLGFKDLRVFRHRDVLVAVFQQNYKADNGFASTGLKRLYLRPDGWSYKIVGEEFQPLPDTTTTKWLTAAQKRQALESGSSRRAALEAEAKAAEAKAAEIKAAEARAAEIKAAEAKAAEIKAAEAKAAEVRAAEIKAAEAKAAEARAAEIKAAEAKAAEAQAAALRAAEAKVTEPEIREETFVLAEDDPTAPIVVAAADRDIAGDGQALEPSEIRTLQRAEDEALRREEGLLHQEQARDRVKAAKIKNKPQPSYRKSSKSPVRELAPAAPEPSPAEIALEAEARALAMAQAKLSGQPLKQKDLESYLIAQARLWAVAWNWRDVDSYFSFYHPEFYDKARKLDLPGYIAYRTPLIVDRKVLEVKQSHFSVTMLPDKLARLTFRQDYRSDVMRTIGWKILVFKESEEGWKIISETWRSL